MLNSQSNVKSIDAEKITIGEKIEFDTFIQKQAFTQYGEVTVNIFAKDGVVTRKVMSDSLGNWLKQNQPKKYVILKNKLVDGDFTHNVFVGE